MSNFCIEAEQLRNALRDIEKAEANGFNQARVEEMLDESR